MRHNPRLAARARAYNATRNLAVNLLSTIHQHSYENPPTQSSAAQQHQAGGFFLSGRLLYLLAAAKYFYFGGGLHPDLHVTVALVGAAILQFLASVSEFYRSITERTNSKHITKIVLIWLITCALVLLWGFVVGETDKFARSVIGLWFALTPVVLIAWHLMIRMAVASIRANSASDVVVFGAGEVGEKFAREVRQSPWLGYKIAGFFDDKLAQGETVAGMPVLGSIAEGIELAKKSQWRKAYIALPLKAQDKIEEIIGQLADSAVDIELIPDIFGFELINAKISQIGNLPVIALQASPISGYNAALKRLMGHHSIRSHPHNHITTATNHRPRHKNRKPQPTHNLQTAPLRPQRQRSNSLEIPHHDRAGGWKKRQTSDQARQQNN